MTRIRLIEPEQAPITARPYYAHGDPGPIVSALAHVPELLEVAMPFLGTVLGPSALPLRTKEIVILRTSALAGCAFCIDTHTVVARDGGLSPDEVRALRGEATAEVFDRADEAVLLRWVDEVATVPGEPDEAVCTAMRAHFGQAGLVELTTLVGATLLLNRLATSLKLPTSEETRQRLAAEELTGVGMA